MNEDQRTREQLLMEIEELRHRVAGLEKETTHVRAVQKALDESEAKSRAILNAIPDLMFQVTGEGVFIGYKAAREELYVPPEMFLGRRVDEVLPRDLAEMTMKHLKQALTSNQIQVYEYELAMEGERRHFECRMVKSTENEVLAIIRDITPRWRMEEEIRKGAEKIKMFAYSVSHDLKSPALGLYGLARRLSRNYAGALDEKGRRYCDQLLVAAEQINALVEKVNMYIAAKEAPLNIEGLRLEELIGLIRDEFSPRLNQRRIAWREPKNPPEIRADRLSIIRVLRNLVDNALKYGGDGLGLIEIGYQDADECHMVFVRDDGVGIKARCEEDLFGAFSRNGAGAGIEGSGLGLAIVKEIAEHHQGRVWVASGPELGATVFFSISKNL
ncbi:MAG: ATP-binding protein [Thermodesulfobacteriota bacterium]